MSTYSTDTTAYQQGSVTTIAYLDLQHIAARNNPNNRQIYPLSTEISHQSVNPYEICLTKIGTRKSDGKLLVITSLNGEEGNSILSKGETVYDSDIQRLLSRRYRVAGVATQSSFADIQRSSSGFLMSIAGVVDIYNPERLRLAPGTRLRVKYPTLNVHNRRVDMTTADGAPYAKYKCGVEEDTPKLRAEVIVKDLCFAARDPDTYRQILAINDRNGAEKTLTAAKALHDAGMLDGLLMMYVFKRMNFISFRQDPTITTNPYDSAGNSQLMYGGLSENMTPEEWIIRAAQLLGLIAPSVGSAISASEKVYFGLVRHAVVNTQNADASIRTYNFGVRNGGAAYPTRTTDGSVDMHSDGGRLLSLQLNHKIKALSAIFQQFEEQDSQVVGTVLTCDAAEKYITILSQPGGMK